jgi:predicted permease
LLLAAAGLRLLISLAERYSPRASEIRLDGMVLGFTLLLTLAVALVLSFTPGLGREGTLRLSRTFRRQRLQRGLVVAQIAVSVILLSGAGLLIRSMLRLGEVDTGLDGDGVLTMEVSLDGTGRSEADTKGLFERMRFEIGALPGVSQVGLGSTMPLRSGALQLEIKAEGKVPAPGEAIPRAEYRTANPAYFRAAGIPLLKGREFAATDGAGSPLVVVLNRTLAARLFPDRDPIGQRVAWTGDVLRFIPVSPDWRTVVGVVGDTRDGGLDAEPRPVVFHPFDQDPGMMGAGLVIRASSDATTLIPAATRLVRSLAPGGPIENVLTVDQIRDESIAPRRLNAALVSSFGGLAVIITAVGIAGVLAFSVSARTNEIGIRMSLGADSREVQRMVLVEGGMLLAVGLALGIAGSFFATRLIGGLLFRVAPHDPATLVSVILMMTGIGLAACWLPALRAARIDPAVAIRGQ